ncbi:FAD-binding oxidoreductase [Chloroflexi bacterium TSY]|nr:FAD-binding oxidoreductase [Chloroflexi bacterium TSY]
MKRKILHSYSGLHHTRACIYAPKTVDELRTLFQDAQAQRRRVTLHGGGYSFDSQALNDDLVIAMDNLHAIKSIHEKRAQITVEPGARWRDILQQLHPLGLTMPIVVTTGQTTAGGTLAANCYSRNSWLHGKEGDHVERFQLLTVAGQLLECSRTENADLFYAVIGGFGSIGAVTEITYNLLHIGNKTQIYTSLQKVTSIEALVSLLRQYSAELKLEDWNALYAAFFLVGADVKGFVARSRYDDCKRYRRFLLYRSTSLLSVPFQWLMRSARFNQWALQFGFHFLIQNNESFLDDLEGYTFFMEGNRLAKEIAQRFNIILRVIQQTYLVPIDKLHPFLDRVVQILQKHKLRPAMLDIVPIQEDDFLLSASRELPGYAVSLAFEDFRANDLDTVIQQLQEMSAVCQAQGGRVHLVKNVYATPEQIAAMYAESGFRFLKLKQRFDPNNVLRNEFFERVFSQFTTASSPSA